MPSSSSLLLDRKRPANNSATTGDSAASTVKPNKIQQQTILGMTQKLLSGMTQILAAAMDIASSPRPAAGSSTII